LTRTGKIFIAAATSSLLVAAAFVFYFFDPEEITFFPRCPFLQITGYECPGCGSQRAIHDMLHLDFKGAVAQNTLILFLVPYVFLGCCLTFFNGKRRFPKLEELFFGKWAAIIVVSGIIIYWVGRNL